MDKTDLIDKVLAMLSGDMDDMEGNSALSHSMDECPDPLGCRMHDSEEGDNLSGEDKNPAALKIEVSKMGLPSMEGELADGAKAEDSLSPDEAEELRKLLGAK